MARRYLRTLVARAKGGSKLIHSKPRAILTQILEEKNEDSVFCQYCMVFRTALAR